MFNTTLPHNIQTLQPDLQWLVSLQEYFKKAEYIQVSSDTWLRTLHFKSSAPDSCLSTLIIVPGWLSPISSWKRSLPIYLKKMNVVLVETREKASAITTNNSSFEFVTFINDLTKVINVLTRTYPTYALQGISMGANLILEIYGKLTQKPTHALLIAPSKQMQVPSYTRLLNIMPTALVGLLRRGIRFYFQFFKKTDPTMVQREVFFATLDNAHDHRAKKSALGLLHRPKLSPNVITLVDCPCLVIAALNDSFHSCQEAEAISRELTSATCIVLDSFPRVYTSDLAKEQLHFLETHKFMTA